MVPVWLCGGAQVTSTDVAPVTVTTSAGEGSSSPRLAALPAPTPTQAPVALGGGRTWRVGAGAGVTLGCRGHGTPTPTVRWTVGGLEVTSGQYAQLLPGGDLHLTGVGVGANYTCWVRNKVGVDSLTHHVVVVSPPPPPTLSLAHASTHALNLTMTPNGDGGAPILGYTVHHRGRAGEWVETEADPGVGVRSVGVRGLPCGAAHHIYVTAWNAHGTSTPSPVLVARTHGAPPGRPDPSRIVEVNATCATLRLYAWPESGCPVTHWKVEQGGQDGAVVWAPVYPMVARDTADLGVCGLDAQHDHAWLMLRLTASSTAGETTVVYRVAAQGGELSEVVQEVVMAGSVGGRGWLDAHVVAGVVSAVLLATAIVICVCVVVRRRRYGEYRQGDSLDQKEGGGEDDNARNSELTRGSHLYSPTPTKKPRGSLASVKTTTQDDPTNDPYEICPYATFSDRHPLEAPGYAHPPRQRSQSHYKETELAYISSRSSRGGGAGGGEYITRPKSIPSAKPTPTPAPTPTPTPVPTAAASTEARAWVEGGSTDTRGRPHRSRSRNTADSVRRDSSTESNDGASPVQQRHYQPLQPHPHPLQPLPQHPGQPGVVAGGRVGQQGPAGGGGARIGQPQGSVVAAGAGGRVAPHPLPPVRLAR